MRYPHPLIQERHRQDSTMTPMIDVVFLLLVFFVWTASFKTVELILPSEVSAQEGSQPTTVVEPVPEQDFDQVVIRLQWLMDQAHWSINETAMGSIEEVSSFLQQLVQIKSDAPIIIHPDPAVPMNWVIEAYDRAKLAGFEQISFAVNPGERG